MQDTQISQQMHNLLAREGESPLEPPAVKETFFRGMRIVVDDENQL
jgi:hypothetical protein